MPTVGRMLATERQRQGLEPGDVARGTKIGVRLLEAIEQDNFEELPGMVFARNFVRQYAQFLGMDEAGVIEQFNREQMLEPVETVAIPDQEDRKIRVPRMDSGIRRSGGDGNALSAFVSLVLIITVCAGAFATYKWLANRPAPAKPAAAATPQATPERTTKAAETAPPPAAVAAAAPSTGVPELSSKLAATTAAQVNASIAALEPSWIRISADGQVVFVGVLAAGETRQVRAVGVVSVRTGNAGGLAVKLNGADIAPIGPKGQIRVITLTPAGAQVRNPIPEPVVPPAAGAAPPVA